MININQLTFGYRKQPPLYDNLSLQLDSGSIIGLLGKNGSGKTTLLKLVAGLLKDTKGGSIDVFGFNPKDQHPDFLKDICFIPEEFELPATTANNYIKAICGYYPNFDHDKLNRILDEFELKRTDKLHKLSYGQTKKFLIAITLSCGSKLLILDEPTNGLDIPSKALFRKVMAGALTDDQLVIISTHQIKDIENIIDKILIIDKGEVKLNESIYNITQNYAFHAARNPDDYNCIYKEAIPGGYKIITPRDGEETNIDIETLFNAIANDISFNKTLNTNTHEYDK